MNTALYGIGAIALAIAGAAGAHDGDWLQDQQAVIVTASNTASNTLLIYGPDGALIKKMPTEGQGGVSGNSGGIAQNHDRLAVVNFGSANVSVFFKDAERAGLAFSQTVPALASPVSVAFGKDHLYILTTTHVESHPNGPRRGCRKSQTARRPYWSGDGSAAQVGVLPHELVFSEKSNAIETVTLDARGAITGKASMVANIPSNVNAPFGLATRGNDAFVTIAHANEISLVRHDAVLTVTGSGTQSAPLLAGPRRSLLVFVELSERNRVPIRRLRGKDHPRRRRGEPSSMEIPRISLTATVWRPSWIVMEPCRTYRPLPWTKTETLRLKVWRPSIIPRRTVSPSWYSTRLFTKENKQVRQACRSAGLSRGIGSPCITPPIKFWCGGEFCRYAAYF